ncbi:MULTISPECIES: hypothetical protein [unclassified Burkholderia]|uniref:hypothetical protein n=1 Tax=unclassified Burkholderia TaxID=2613784 RepID=UPI002AB0D4BD|nr:MULTISPECIES: hypothetical protein [unclassified Burkholderia]
MSNLPGLLSLAWLHEPGGAPGMVCFAVGLASGALVIALAILVVRAALRRPTYMTRDLRKRHLRYLNSVRKELVEFQVFLEQADQTRHPVYRSVEEIIQHVGEMTHFASIAAARADEARPDLPHIAREHLEGLMRARTFQPVTVSHQVSSSLPQDSPDQAYSGRAPLDLSPHQSDSIHEGTISLDQGSAADENGRSASAAHVWKMRGNARLSGS